MNKKITAKAGQANPGARRPGADVHASQYARSLIDASLNPLVTIRPDPRTAR